MIFQYPKRIILFITAFLLSLCVCFSITAMYIHNKSSMEYAQMEQVVLVSANKINNVITKLLYKTQVLAALAVQNDGDINEFDQVAATISDDPAIKNVLIAPNGIVSNVYPLEGNEEVIGFNFFESGNGNPEAIEARDSGTLVLGGPFDLVQGEQALVGRLPVYTKDSYGNKSFWGLVSVTLHYPQALDGAGLDQLQNQGFAYEIWRISPDTNERQVIANSNYSYDHNALYVEKNITILNATWQFRISPIKSWKQYPETWILGTLGLLASGLIAFFSLNTYNLKVMKMELEILTYVDPLTEILNRRGILSALTKLVNEPDCKFVLCYIDLNKFKSFNDEFGHNTGDKILKQFTKTFTKHTNKKHLFARIGGDEFILVFKDTDSETKTQTFFDVVKHELDHVYVDDYIKGIPITFSVGKAIYPSQCQDVDSLIHCADSDMYQNKAATNTNMQ